MISRTEKLTPLHERVLACFKPAEFSVALHSDDDIVGDELEAKLHLDHLKGYCCGEKIYAELGNNNGLLMYNRFSSSDAYTSPTSILKCCRSEDE